ncbi:MAG TPA: CHAT domain-containing protein [Thermoanaerobaculia bacterium]|nr:CHAT domain-containing protein [Thermoanaerobaculia bacterium]
MRAGTPLVAIGLGTAAIWLASCTKVEDAESLARALGSIRLIEPRLAGGFAHAPCTSEPPRGDRLVPGVRCSPPPTGAERREVGRVVRRLRQPEETALALLLLEADRTDRAIQQLAKLAQPGTARALSNLGAAYLVRAQRQDEPRDLLTAVGILDRAVQADAAFPEALFNRALALEKLFLTAEAQQAWVAYLALDSTSRWAREARAHLAALESVRPQASWEQKRRQLEAAIDQEPPEEVRRLVDPSRRESREEAEQRLGTWAEAAAHGRTDEAVSALNFARAIGDALSRLGGDRMVRDAVAAIDEAEHGGDATRLRALIRGHREYVAGKRLQAGRRTDPDQAETRFAAAALSLSRGQSPFAARALYDAANSAVKRGRYLPSLGAIDRLETAWIDRSYPSLLASTAMLRGFVQAVLGRVADSLLSYNQAEERFRAAGESENADLAEGLAAENFRSLGETKNAWRSLYRFLCRTPDLRSPENLFLAFVLPADQLLEERQPALALHFQNAVIRHAERSENPSLIGDAYFWRALMFQRLGRLKEARNDLQRSRPVLESLGESGLKRRVLADLQRIEGEILSVTEPVRAVSALQSALQLYEKDQHHLLALLTYRSLAQVYRRLGDVPRTEASLRRGLLAHTRLGEGVSEQELKLSLFERTAEIFDEMIAFQVDVRKRLGLAFAYADLARTRALPAVRPGRGLGRSGELLSPAEIGRRLPEHTALLEFSISEGRLFLWLIRRGGWRFHQESFGAGELAEQIRDLRKGPHLSRERWLSVSTVLFERLIRSVRPHLNTGERLLLVPDKLLHAVPFAALRDGQTGRFLIEDFEIAYVPSAALLRKSRGFARAPLPLLAIGNPKIDRRFPLLANLPGALREAEAVAALVPGARRLTAGAARRGDFLALAPRARWIHVASHGVVNRRDPLLSMLVFTPDDLADSGALLARDIAALQLSRAESVVLSACDTGPQLAQGTGGHSLARAFLAASVPTVVASLESIDEARFGKEVEQLFRTYYRELLQGRDPVAALGTAQREHLEADSAVWSTFAVYTTQLQRP